MKKGARAAGVMFWGVLLIFASGFLRGQDLRVQLHAGAALPSDRQLGSSIETGFGAVLTLSREFVAVLEYDSWQSRVTDEPFRLYGGRLTAMPLSLSLRCSLLKRGALILYISGGGSIVANRFSLDRPVTIPEVRISQTVNNAIGLRLGTGAEGRVSSRLFLFLEAAYLWAGAEAATTVSDMNLGVSRKEFTIRLDSFHMRAGLRYAF